MQKFKDVVGSVNTGNTDVKAEVVIADIHKKDIDFDNIEVLFDGVFERNYKKDITGIRVDMVKEVISLRITRDSLYDMLPEGLFHPVVHYSLLDEKERKRRFNIQRQEEEKSRRFFRPFDKEFLLQKVNMELSVRKLYEYPYKLLKAWFANEKKIPDRYFKRLIKFLPFTGYIKGNLDLTAHCLSEILGEKVIPESYYSKLTLYHPSQNSNSRLGTVYLGENLICGSGLEEDVLVWDFIIKINNEKGLARLVNNEQFVLKDFMDVFSDYFVPLEVMTDVKIISTECKPFYLEQGKDKIGEPEQMLYLGYNMRI